MKKKGFTLIELLAVIIILAVIALIATPIVLNVVENAQIEARKQSVVGYADAVRLSYIEEKLNPTGENLSELATKRLQGNKVECNIVKYDEELNGTMLYGCSVEAKGNYCYFGGKVYDYVEGSECDSVSNIISTGKIEYKSPIITVDSQIPNDTEYAQSKVIKVSYPTLGLVEEHYFVMTNKEVEINNIKGVCGNNEIPGECTESNTNTIEANTWYEVYGEVKFDIAENMITTAATGMNGNYAKVSYTESKIDTTAPSVSMELVSKSDRIIVEATCSDEESDISKYEYKIGDGEYVLGTTGHVFYELSKNTEYEVSLKCTNGSGVDNVITDTISTKDMVNPTIEQYSQTPESGTYAQERVIRITFDGTNVVNPKYYYSLDGKTWTEVSDTTKDITFTEDGELYAKTVDEKGNTANASTYTVMNIDTENPTHDNWWWGDDVTTDVAKLYIQASDNLSGIDKVQCNVSTQTGEYNNWTSFDAVYDSDEDAYRCDITPSTFGHYSQTYKAHLYMYDNAGNGGYYDETTVDIPSNCQYAVGQTWSYSSNVNFEIPCTGTYRLEAWGAQGGGITLHNATTGGYGGYAAGNRSFTSGQIIYVVVGGKGSDGWAGAGGYNGGGQGGSASDCAGAGGGGCTHFSFQSGLLRNTSSSNVILVAGGGGGGASHNVADGSNGGPGGTSNPNDQANKTGGFGYGASNIGVGGGGGCGYQGGSMSSMWGGGSGGSNYTGGLSNTSSSAGSRSGSGYARITLLSY